jgi:hypothetical protein
MTTINVVPKSLKAWINNQPGVGAVPKLIVTLEAEVEIDWKVTLVSAVPQGINPLVKLLEFDVVKPTGPHSNAIAKRAIRYEEAPLHANYSDVTIENGGQNISASVERVS